MCGIVGSIRFHGVVDVALLERQRDTLTHRGPDSAGLWCADDGRVGFGHRRLAIIDRSSGGHQPMVDPETGNVLTFNGEIYNFRALRDDLARLGHRWRSTSDTEVILAAWRQWGPSCVARLDGMFAFALYEAATGRVVLARDRVGEKPLFYHRTADQLSFASEMKALLADPVCPRRLSLTGLNEYLAYGYVTGEATLLADIRRVAPGTYLEIAGQGDAVTTHRYWTMPDAPALDAVDPAALPDQLEAILRQSVRRQLVADVPIGVLLSGGVDSSLITALAAAESTHPLRTFTVRFPDAPTFDEGPFARQVATHFGTVHTELQAEAADAALLHALAIQFDDPIADSSMVPTHLVSRAIRAHATVAIGGDGGDELFGGYLRYPALLRQEQWRQRIPAWIRRPLVHTVAAVWPASARGHGVLEAMAGDAGHGIAAAGRMLRAAERQSLSPALRRLAADALDAPERRRRDAERPRGLLGRATAVDFTTYLVDDVLVKVDRASMLASLEVRAPLLDVDVMQFALGAVPDPLKATATARKVLLRQVAARLLPPTLDLTRKQGFAMPVAAALRGAWRTLRDIPMAPVLGEAIDPVRSAALYARLDAGDDRAGDACFALLMLQLWSNHYRIGDLT